MSGRSAGPAQAPAVGDDLSSRGRQPGCGARPAPARCVVADRELVVVNLGKAAVDCRTHLVRRLTDLVDVVTVSAETSIVAR